jgi:hypothetical protein
VKPFQVSDPAATELAHAIRWYEQQRAGLGSELFDAIHDTGPRRRPLAEHNARS